MQRPNKLQNIWPQSVGFGSGAHPDDGDTPRCSFLCPLRESLPRTLWHAREVVTIPESVGAPPGARECLGVAMGIAEVFVAASPGLMATSVDAPTDGLRSRIPRVSDG